MIQGQRASGFTQPLQFRRAVYQVVKIKSDRFPLSARGENVIQRSPRDIVRAAGSEEVPEVVREAYAAAEHERSRPWRGGVERNDADRQVLI